MKRIISAILLVTYLLLIPGCSKHQLEEPNEPAPSIVVDNQHFYASNMPVNELPEGYVFIGILPESAANGTGLEGCKMYALKEEGSFQEFYLYQECGTPIGNHTVDNTKRLWAYVHWSVREN